MSNRTARILPLIAILIVAMLGMVFLRDRLSFETLAEHHDALLTYRDAHYPLALVAFMAAYVAIVAFSLPGATIASLTGGFLFGIFPGTLINVVSATTGATLLFLAARMGLGERLARRIEANPGTLQRLKRGIDANQWSVLFLMRLLPAVPFFVANLLPALISVPLHRFAVTTFFGIMPGALIYTSVGAGLGEVIARGERPDLSAMVSPPVLLPILGLALLAALPMGLRLIRRVRA